MDLVPKIVWPNRNTKCMEVQIGPHCYLMYSYNTLVGAMLNGKGRRIKNTWGPTTGKHIKSDLHIDHYEVVDAKVLAEFVNEHLSLYFQDQLRERFL